MDSQTTPFLPKRELYYFDSSDDKKLSASPCPESGYDQRCSRRWLRSIFHYSIIFLAAWGLISLCLQGFKLFQKNLFPSNSLDLTHYDVYRPSTLEPGLNLCDCGGTIEEAKQRDCIYDSLSTAWLPPYCRDDELTAEFDKAGPEPDGSWPYFADEKGTIPINVSQIAELGPTEGRFWALREWHVAHCLFYWQKYWRMRDTGSVMELRFDKLEHVKHCGRLAMNKQPDHRVLIEVPVLMKSRLVEPEELEHHHHMI